MKILDDTDVFSLQFHLGFSSGVDCDDGIDMYLTDSAIDLDDLFLTKTQRLGYMSSVVRLGYRCKVRAFWETSHFFFILLPLPPLILLLLLLLLHLSTSDV